MLESMAAPFVISPPERRELMKIANSRSARSEDGRRARIILDLGRGLSLRAISAGERCRVNTVRLWRERFREDRLAGLYSRHRGRQPTPGREKLEARIIDWTLHRKPSGGATQWSTPVWPESREPPRRMSRRSGARLVFNPIASGPIWPATILTSRPRRPMSSVSTSTRQ